MRLTGVLLALTCLMLGGCTKSEETEQPRRTQAPRPNQAAAEDNRAVIAVLGDSLAEGFGTEQGQSFPDQLQRILDRDGYGYRVVNLGVSGDTTTGGLGRVGYAVSLKPAIVILELGGNDGLRGIPVASTKANLDQMIAAVKKAGGEVLLAGMTLPPNYGPQYIRSFESIYRDLGRKHSIPVIPFLMEDIRTQPDALTQLMQRDGIHPTAKGHTVIAETVFRYLKPMLKKRT